MSSANAGEGWELVVGTDGSIPAEQLVRLGVAPGAHLRVVAEPAQGADKVGKSLAGRLWERFDDDAVDRFDAALAANRKERILAVAQT
jgi:hypothetical protein